MGTIAAGSSAEHGTLVATTVTTVTFTDDFSTLEIVNVDGAAAIYYTTNGSTPTVGGAGTRVLPAAIGVDKIPAAGGSAPVVKLISAGTPKYAVQGS